MQLIRSAVRLYRRQPGYAVTSSVSIAVGMSLALAVFGVVNAVLFRPLPFLDADRLVMMFVPFAGGPTGRFSLLDAIHRGDASSIVQAAAYSSSPTIVGQSGEARTLVVARVSPDFFAVIGARPIVGADLDVQGDGRGDRTALISHSVWTTQFGSDRAAIGSTIVIDGEPRTILGVMPSGFDFPARASVWLPIVTAARRAQSGASYFILARLDDDASVPAAAGQVAVVNRRLVSAVTSSISSEPRVISLRTYLTGSLRDQLQLWVAVAILVAILCAVNFATMSFARGTARGHEIALRRAVGASAGRVTAELVGESATVALIGGVLTIPLAWGLLRFADVWLADSAFAIAGKISWETAGLGILATGIVGVAFAALPAVDAAMVDIRSVMQSGASGTTSRHRELRSRKALVGLQVTLALTATALVAALAYADRRYQPSEIRVDYSRLLMATVSSVDTSLGPIELKPLIDHVAGAAGIETAAALNACDEAAVAVHSESRAGLSAIACNASPTLFATFGMKMVAGRLPTTDEVSSRADVVVLTRSLAAGLFGSSAMSVGRRIEVARVGWESRPRDVVGVVEDMGDGLFGFNPAIIRVQNLAMRRSAGLAVRTRLEPQTVMKSFASVVRSADSRIMVSDVATAADKVSRGRLKAQGRTYLLACVAALAVVLAVIGVFSLTAYSTALRAREFSIRIALGATPRRLISLLVRELRWSVAIGVAAGVLATILLTAWLDALVRPVYMTSALVTLPMTALVASSGALLLILALGTAVPLRRLLRMDVARSLGAP